MTRLRSLELCNFRNFSHLLWQLPTGVNFLLGDNGAGKSSILEAIYFLGRGRSFRTTRHQDTINHSFSNAIIKIICDEESGIQSKNKTASFNLLRYPHWNLRVDLGFGGTKTVLLDGKKVDSIVSLAKRIPLVFIGPHNVNLINAAPSQRRAFLDGINFHVWTDSNKSQKNYEHCLRQRNKLLHNKPKSYDIVAAWDIKIAQLGEEIEKTRQKLISLMLEPITKILQKFNIHGVSIDYERGWDEDIPLVKALQKNFIKDTISGFSSCGCHRADLKIRIHQREALKVLSLGQQKILSLAFFCAARLILQEKCTRPVLLLLDDVIAQLDASNREMLLLHIANDSAQTFITSTNDKSLIKWCEGNGATSWNIVSGKLIKSV